MTSRAKRDIIIRIEPNKKYHLLWNSKTVRIDSNKKKFILWNDNPEYRDK